MAANTPSRSLNVLTFKCMRPIDEEWNKLPIALLIDDKSHICNLCFKRWRKRKSFREGWQESTEEIVQTFSRAFSEARESGSLPSSFAPLDTRTTIKFARPNNSSMTVNVVNPSQVCSSRTCLENPNKTKPK